ncbi:MAG: hypothetical protein FJZ01_03685 [Candidatus Sericytochromatia bacterium]|nr:hypothetical protein [Candidatus Tanganyikabacteria bacterium]
MLGKSFVRRSVWLAFSAHLMGCGQGPAASRTPAAPAAAATEATDSVEVQPIDDVAEPEFVETSLGRSVSQIPDGIRYGAPLQAPAQYPAPGQFAMPGQYAVPAQYPAPGQFAFPGQTEVVPPLAYGADPALLGRLPAEIPADLAVGLLSPLDPAWLAPDLAPDAFAGSPGTYLGYPPGMASYFQGGRVRVLYVGGVLVPFVLVAGRWVPLAFLQRSTGLYIYPTFVNAGGAFAPIFHASPTFYEPYSRKFGHGRHEILSRLGWLGKYRPRIGLPKHKVAYLREAGRKHGQGRFDRLEFRKIKRWR